MAAIKNVDDLGELSEQELEELYTWLDSIPLTRPKRNITRDFSDGVLVAEVVKHFVPKMVDVHNYSPANSTPQKMQNWFLLNRKVFKKLRFELSEDVIRHISNCKTGVVERILSMLRTRIERVVWETQQQTGQGLESDRPEADQNTFNVTNVDSSKKIVKERDIVGHGNNVASTLSYKSVKGKSDMVPLLLLEEKEQEILAKDETIQILQAKIKRLEHLLHLKDIRIEDLQARVEATRPTGKR